jgi:galactose mutarotase-like enzyme
MDGAVSRQIRLENGTCAAVVDPTAGGRLASLTVDDHELLVPHGEDAFHWGSFPMAPWVGRLRHGRFELDGRTVQLPINARPHALHGLVSDRPWEVVRTGAATVELSVHLGTDGDPWPWACEVGQSVTLHEEGMDFRLTVRAEDAMPADIGWHPWFARRLATADGGVEAELDVLGGQIYRNDAEEIPTGELGPPPPRPWDYCFTGLERPPTVRWPGILAVTVDSDCDHWVFYDRESAGICVEPWTGPPNSLNRPSRTIVTPERPLEAAMTWRWRRDG